MWPLRYAYALCCKPYKASMSIQVCNWMNDQSQHWTTQPRHDWMNDQCNWMNDQCNWMTTQLRQFRYAIEWMSNAIEWMVNRKTQLRHEWSKPTLPELHLHNRPQQTFNASHTPQQGWSHQCHHRLKNRICPLHSCYTSMSFSLPTHDRRNKMYKIFLAVSSNRFPRHNRWEPTNPRRETWECLMADKISWWLVRWLVGWSANYIFGCKCCV